MRHVIRSGSLSWLAVALAAVVCGTAHAQSTTTWNGGAGSGDWSTAGNWNGGAPSTTGTWALTFSGTTQTSSTNTIGGTTDTITLSSLAFINDTSAGAAGNMTLAAAGSRTLTLANAAVTANTLTSSATNTISIPLALVGSSTVTINSNNRLDLNGVISGTGSLRLNGGTLGLGSNSNSFSGGFTLAGGQIDFFQNGVFGSGTLNLNAGTLNARGSARAIATSGAITGNVGIGTPGNNNQITLSGSFDLSGGTRTLTINGGTSHVLSGVLSNGGITKGGTNTLILTGSNAYSGATTINSGTLQIGNSGTTGALNTASTITGSAGATLAFNRTDTVTQGTDFTSVIDGAINVAQNGSGTLVLNGANTYSGTTSINAGTLQFVSPAALYGGTTANWTAAAIVTGSGATLAVNVGASNFTTSSVTTLLTNLGGLGGTVTNNGLQAGSSIAFDTSNAGGAFTVADAIKDSTGTGGGAIRLAKLGSGTLVLTGSNGYTGTTTVSQGVLQIGANGTAGTLGTGAVTNNGTLTFNRTDAYGGAVANAISGSGSLTLASGTLTLSGTNTYSGATAINAGTLKMGSATAFGSSNAAVTVASGAVLDLAGITGTSTNPYALTINGSGVSGGGAIVNSSATAATFYGPVTLGSDSTIGAGGANVTVYNGITGNYALTVSVSAKQLQVYGNVQTASVTLGAGTLRLESDNSFAGGLTIKGGSVVAKTVKALGGTGTGTVYLGDTTGSSNATLSLGFSGTYGNPIVVQPGNTGVAQLDNYTNYTVTASGSVTLNKGLTLAGGTAGQSLTVSGPISGAGGLTIQSSGTSVVALTGSNTFTGTTTMSSASPATLQVGNVWALQNSTLDTGAAGNQSVTFTAAGTNTYVLGGLQGSKDLSVGANSITVGGNGANTTFAGAISGSGGLAKTGSGALTLSGSNTFTGGATLSAGQLNINNANALGTGTLTITTGTIDNSSGAAVILATNNDQAWNGDFTFAGSSALNLGTGAVTLGANRVVTVNSSTLGIGGAIGGAFSFTKAGAGTLVLSASNARTQATTINAGTISLTGLSGTGALPSASDLANTPITINTGATLLAGGTVAGQNSHLINQDLTLNGGTLASNGVSGNSNYNFAFNGAKIIAGGGTTSTISAQIGLYGLREFQVGAGSTLTASGRVGNWENQQWGTINKTGDGVLSLAFTDGNNNNTYAGLVLNAGTVVVSSGAWGNSNANANYYRADFQGNATLRWAAGNTFDISASNKFRIADGVTATLDTGTNAVTLATAIVLGTNKTAALTKLGSGTLTISASNAYTGATTISAGVLAITDKAALQGTSGLTIAGGAGLRYTGTADTFAKNITVTAGSGTGTITNSGNYTLTLSGTLSKDNSVLRLTGGAFNVTGVITGTTVGASDLVVDAAAVTLSNTNTYNGPTYAYNTGTLSLGIDNAIPSTSAVTLGNATTQGTLVMGSYSDSISQLVFSGSGGTLSLSGDKTAAVQLATNGSLTLGSNASLVLTSPGSSAGLYRLISATSISGSFAPGNVTGTPANYALLYSGTEVDLQLKANQAASFTLTAATSRALVNTTVALSGSITNSSPAGSANLGVSLSSGGVLAVTGLSSGTSSLAPQASTAVAGTIQAGGVAGSQSWSVINTDASSITTTSTAYGSLQVVNQRTFTTSTSTLDVGLVHTGASFGSPTLVVTSTGLYATTASGTLGSFAGGPGGFSLTTRDPTAFNGGSASQSATYTLSGAASTPGAISGTFTSSVSAEFGTIPNVTVAVSGQVFSGTATWNVNGGGSWGSGATANWMSAGGVGAAPGTFNGYTNTDVAIFSGTQGGTSTVSLDGATPSLASLAFNNTTGSYLIDQGSSGSLMLASASGAPTIDVAANALAEIKTAILGSAGLQKLGAGTLMLSGSNGFTGATAVAAGTLVVDGSLLGAVNVAGGATLAGVGSVGGLVTVAGDGILSPGNGVPGTFVAGGGLSLVDAAILNFQLSTTSTTAGGGINDLVTVTGNLTLDGVLNVAAIGGDFTNVLNGTHWRLFNYSGTLTNNGLTFGAMPSLGGDRYYAVDTSAAGVVDLIVVPEPGSLALAGIGVGIAFCLARRRAKSDRLEFVHDNFGAP